MENRDRRLAVGDHVLLTDEFGADHNALVTATFGWREYGQREDGCNVVIVHSDESREDSYGRQIDRYTSVVHRSEQPADGNFWRWPDEPRA